MRFLSYRVVAFCYKPAGDDGRRAAIAARREVGLFARRATKVNANSDWEQLSSGRPP